MLLGTEQRFLWDHPGVAAKMSNRENVALQAIIPKELMT